MYKRQVHPANSVAGLWTTVTTNNVNVVYDHPVSTMEGRGDSTATGTAVAVVPDISTTVGESSLSGISNHQHQSCKTAFPGVQLMLFVFQIDFSLFLVLLHGLVSES